jgi:NADPH-dependent 2,4-dienoyl-CoA reductase/sulfur reductase-like enzyme/rhodanese-related sulfurtransferase
MSAAARARRVNEQAEITVLEKSGFISFANCGLPYYIGGQIKQERNLLLTTPERVAERFRIDARVQHEVTRIDRQAKRVHGIDHRTNQPFSIDYDKLILAPGASPIIPNLDGADASNVFVLRNVEDTRAMKTFIDERAPKRAVVVGAGFIGLEMVEALKARHIEVTVLEKAPHALPVLDADLAGWLEAELTRNGVALRMGTGLSVFERRENVVTAVITETRERIETDLVILSMGVRPNLELARLAGITVGASGGIATDEYRRTSDPDIYAVGDAAEVVHGVTGSATRIPLAGAANRHGRIAGEHAATGASRPAGAVLGTAVVRVFGLDVAVTGLSRRAATAAGRDVDTVMVHPNDHAGYYPGAQSMHLMLVYERSTRKVLGAQAIGPAGVDKRIDVVATTLHFGGTIDDLADLDLTYAPQFSGAKDPLHFAAFVAQNQSSGLSPGADLADIALDVAATNQPVTNDATSEKNSSNEHGASKVARNGADTAQPLLLDVRTPSEFKQGNLKGALNIPLDELRQRVGELDPRRPIVVYCQVGVRGHAAVRLLKGHGFLDVRNLKGGYVHAALRQATP